MMSMKLTGEVMMIEFLLLFNFLFALICPSPLGFLFIFDIVFQFPPHNILIFMAVAETIQK